VESFNEQFDILITYLTSLAASLFTIIAIVSTINTNDLYQLSNEIKTYLKNISEQFSKLKVGKTSGEQEKEVKILYFRYKSLIENYDAQKVKTQKMDVYVETIFTVSYLLFATSLLFLIFRFLNYYVNGLEALLILKRICLISMIIYSWCFYHKFTKFVNLFLHKVTEDNLPSLEYLFSPNNILDIKDANIRFDLPMKLFAVSTYFNVDKDYNNRTIVRMFSNGLFEFSASFYCEDSLGNIYDGDFTSKDILYDKSFECYILKFGLLPPDTSITRIEIGFESSNKGWKVKREAVYKQEDVDKPFYFYALTEQSSKMGLTETAKMISLKKI
jgi:hypothetical protein